MRLLFAGIQSIHGKAYGVQQCDLILIDEAHLIPRASDTMYRRFLDALTKINPHLKVIGFTATPYRLDSGLLHRGDDALFTDIAFEASAPDLIRVLCSLVSKSAVAALDVTGVGSRGGEFIPSQLQAAVDRADVTRRAIEEIISYGEGRRSWLAFCSGVDHSTHVAEAIRERGFSCASIFGDTPKMERDRIVAAFKRGEIRALASMGVLTTGFNAPAVDLIAMLRPTKSAGLYVQMVGRGARLAPGKENCLVLDFAGNVARHGPIDMIKPTAPDVGEGEAPVKVCPACAGIIYAALRECPDCGHVFPLPDLKIEPEAASLEVISSGSSQWVAVSGVSYDRHEKPGKPPSLRVDYRCGLVRHREWVCIEHTGYAREKAVSWWRRRSPESAPVTVDQALAQVGGLRVPVEIAAPPNGILCRLRCVGALLMIDPTPNEIAALDHGGLMGGEERWKRKPWRRRSCGSELGGVASVRRGRRDRLLCASRTFLRSRVGRSGARAFGCLEERRGAVLMTAVSDNFMARFGARLIDNGYPVIPIWPGAKKPGRFHRGSWGDDPDRSLRSSCGFKRDRSLGIMAQRGSGVRMRLGDRRRHRRA